MLVRPLSNESDRLNLAILENSGRQKGSLPRTSKSTESENAEVDDTPHSGDDEPCNGGGEGGASDDAEALQAANLLGTLPFELICEASRVYTRILSLFGSCLTEVARILRSSATSTSTTSSSSHAHRLL